MIKKLLFAAALLTVIGCKKKAVLKEEPIVITGWKPHYKWADYDLKYLADSKNIYPKDECQIISRLGFKEDFPKVAAFLANFTLSEEQLYPLMNAIQTAESDKEAAALNWYEANKELVNSWWPKD